MHAKISPPKINACALCVRVLIILIKMRRSFIRSFSRASSNQLVFFQTKCAVNTGSLIEISLTYVRPIFRRINGPIEDCEQFILSRIRANVYLCF